MVNLLQSVIKVRGKLLSNGENSHQCNLWLSSDKSEEQEIPTESLK